MNNDIINQYAIEQFLYQVAEACDNQDWDRYLSYFSEDSVIHIPQWDSEHYYTKDPKKEMSLLYYPSRHGLEDRVFRIRTGQSAASTPLPRTTHLLSNIRQRTIDKALFEVQVNWATHYYRFGESAHFFGRATYHLAEVDGELSIKYKHVVLLNDKIDSVLDFYHV